MEYLGIFGLFGFLLAAQGYTEVKKLKVRVSDLELNLTEIQSQKGA